MTSKKRSEKKTETQELFVGSWEGEKSERNKGLVEEN